MSTDTPNRQRGSAIPNGSDGNAEEAGPANDPSLDKTRANGSDQGNGSKPTAVPEPVGARAGAREAAAGIDSPISTPSGDAETTTTAPAEWAEFSSLQPENSGAAAIVAQPVAKRSRFAWLQIDDRISRLLLSGILAILLWMYVVSLENPTQNAQYAGINVELRAAAPDLKAVVTPEVVDAFVQAPQNVLSSLRRSDVHAYVDLSDVPEGTHSLPVRADVTNVNPRDVNVRFSPSNVQVQLALQSSRVMSVSVQTQGTPGFGYGLEPPQVTPPQVTVSGNQSDVARVSRVVAIVDVDNKAGTQQGTQIPVAYDDKNQEIKGLTFDPPTVSVVVPIKLLLNYKFVPVSVPLVGQPAPGYRVSSIELDPTNVMVCCTPSTLESLKQLNTEPVVISGATSTIITATSLILPPGVQLYPGQPQQITVTVNVELMQTTFQVSVAPTVVGLPPEWSAVVSPNKLDLTLEGTFAQAQDLKPADIRAVVDVRGKGTGTYQITPQVIVPQGIKVNTMSPDVVTVSLTEPTVTPTPSATPTVSPTRTPTLVPTSVPTATRETGLLEASPTVRVPSPVPPTPTSPAVPTATHPPPPPPTSSPSSTPEPAVASPEHSPSPVISPTSTTPN